MHTIRNTLEIRTSLTQCQDAGEDATLNDARGHAFRAHDESETECRRLLAHKIATLSHDSNHSTSLNILGTTTR